MNRKQRRKAKSYKKGLALAHQKTSRKRRGSK